MPYQITRQIEIDAGHRIPDHASQCRNLHGHRYRIEVAVMSEFLHSFGSEAGMVTDFGRLKQILIDRVHNVCDHKFMLHVDDPLVQLFADEDQLKTIHKVFETDPGFLEILATTPSIAQLVSSMPIVICSFVPTAENLGKAWYDSMAMDVVGMVGHPPDYVKVWETPNSTATYQR